jgi:hypothetical protein
MAMSYQEKLTGNSAYRVFAMAMLLVSGRNGGKVAPLPQKLQSRRIT